VNEVNHKHPCLTRTFKHRKRSTVVSWFKTHARLIWWHNVGDRSSRATPSGQQISAADTDAVFCVRIPFMIGDIAATSRISGAALLVLKNPGFGVPSGRPVYIPMVKRSVTPMAYASRNLKLVNVFQA